MCALSAFHEEAKMTDNERQPEDERDSALDVVEPSEAIDTDSGDAKGDVGLY